MDVQLGHIGEAGDLVAAEGGVEDLAVLETHLLAQRRAQSHDDRALDLGEEVVGVQDGAALEHLADAPHGDLLSAGSISTSAQAATKEPFSVPQARPTPTLGVLLPDALLPAEPLGGGFEDGAEARVSRCASRNSSGSAPAAAASSSMKDSRAKLLAVAARAR